MSYFSREIKKRNIRRKEI